MLFILSLGFAFLFVVGFTVYSGYGQDGITTSIDSLNPRPKKEIGFEKRKKSLDTAFYLIKPQKYEEALNLRARVLDEATTAKDTMNIRDAYYCHDRQCAKGRGFKML